MFIYLAEITQLSSEQFMFCLITVFVAGLVRGFAGFALSAIVVASMARTVPTVELIPMAYLLEGAASLVMLRGGVRDADMSIVWVLAIGSAVGVPLGLMARNAGVLCSPL